MGHAATSSVRAMVPLVPVAIEVSASPHAQPLPAAMNAHLPIVEAEVLHSAHRPVAQMAGCFEMESLVLGLDKQGHQSAGALVDLVVGKFVMAMARAMGAKVEASHSSGELVVLLASECEMTDAALALQAEMSNSAWSPATPAAGNFERTKASPEGVGLGVCCSEKTLMLLVAGKLETGKAPVVVAKVGSCCCAQPLMVQVAGKFELAKAIPVLEAVEVC